ncbi:MAG TPA: hypothetical protein PLA19_04715 [Candidatus Pacearchaeota archaeon]|nr:hypothetical protein [Candidatus Pacearchaeota archaeon]
MQTLKQKPQTSNIKFWTFTAGLARFFVGVVFALPNLMRAGIKPRPYKSNHCPFYLEIETLEIHCPPPADPSFGGEIRADFAWRGFPQFGGAGGLDTGLIIC